jgi:hypothetical protein
MSPLLPPFGNISVASSRNRRPAVEPDEVDDVDAGGQFDQPLLEPEQQVIDLGGLGAGLLFGDLADRHEMVLAVVPEVDPAAASALLEPGHWITPMSPQRCCQIVAKLIVTRGADLPQVLSTEGGT